MKQILMVDDVTTNIKCATEVLKDHYQLITAKTGQGALEILENARPDLILLDVNLPDMDGFELMEAFQNNDEIADIPVVFLTAETDTMSEAKGMRLGAMDYIKKPFGPEILLTRINKILKYDDKKKSTDVAITRDSLSTLWNRSSLEKYIEIDEDEKGVFLLLDIDNFKQVNDNFGHLMGDDVLVSFANILQEHAGHGNRVCRIGGDEFVVYLSNLHIKNKIREMARNLVAAVEYEVNKLIDFENELQISISIGISLKPEDGNEFSELYSNADKALYFIKQNGKRGFHFFREADVNGQKLRKDNKQIDLIQLKRLIQETETGGGAYKVEYSGYKRVFRFVSRFVERSGQNAQMVLFTVSRIEGLAEDHQTPIRLEWTMMKLENIVSKSLRHGDIECRLSECQYIVILMDVTDENGKYVVERILEKCRKMIDNDEFKISYDMETINVVDD
ncbi:MAG: diguanylate cyclase [Lachnospiraceae bacterium]|nr:diguanylate cyclase [Lachnospiraceae bacterium]